MKYRMAFPLMLCAVLGGCRHHDSQMDAFVSPDTVVLAGVRMDQLRATSIYRKLDHENRLPHFSDLPSQDMHEVLLASDGKNMLAITKGSVSAKPAGGLSATEYKGFTLYGQPDTVRAAMKQFDSGTVGAPRDLLSRARTVPDNAQIWAVVADWRRIAPDQFRGMGNLGNFDRVMRPLEGATLTFDLRNGVHAAFIGDSRTEADAKTLGDSLRGLAAMVGMAASRNKPQLLGALNGLQVKQEGRVVRMNLDIDEAVAENLTN